MTILYHYVKIDERDIRDVRYAYSNGLLAYKGVSTDSIDTDTAKTCWWITKYTYGDDGKLVREQGPISGELTRVPLPEESLARARARRVALGWNVTFK